MGYARAVHGQPQTQMTKRIKVAAKIKTKGQSLKVSRVIYACAVCQ